MYPEGDGSAHIILCLENLPTLGALRALSPTKLLSHISHLSGFQKFVGVIVVLIAKNSYKCRCLFGPLKLISISVNFEQKKQFTKKSLSSVEYVSTLMIRRIE